MYTYMYMYMHVWCKVCIWVEYLPNMPLVLIFLGYGNWRGPKALMWYQAPPKPHPPSIGHTLSFAFDACSYTFVFSTDAVSSSPGSYTFSMVSESPRPPSSLHSLTPTSSSAYSTEISERQSLERLLRSVLDRLVRHMSAVSDLIVHGDLSLLFGAVSRPCPTYNKMWKKTAADCLIAICRYIITCIAVFNKEFTYHFLCYMHHLEVKMFPIWHCFTACVHVRASIVLQSLTILDIKMSFLTIQ